MGDASKSTSPGTGEIERLRQLFADAFGADVLRELPLRLELLRKRQPRRAHDWNRFTPARPASRT